MSIIKTAVNPLRQSQHKKTNYLIDQQHSFNSDTGVSTKSFEQFIKSPSLHLRNDSQQNDLLISELIAHNQVNDVYNIPWDFKNKLIQQQQQSQSMILKPPIIQPPPPPPPSIKQQQQQMEEYCAPWDLKLQEERFKNLTITTSTTTIGSKSVNTTSSPIIETEQQQIEYSPPWDQKQQNILLKQIQPPNTDQQQQKLSVSFSSSSSLSSLNSTKTNSPTSIQQKSDIASGIIDKFNSLDSNSSSNTSESSFKPMIKPRQSFRQLPTLQPPPLPPLPNISSKAIMTSTLQQPPPLPQIPAYMVTLEKQSWFHGRITRKQAEFLLQDKPVGSFLVRQSESGNTNDFSLSLVGSGAVHMRICLKNGEFILGQCSQPFTSIIKMIEHYSKIEVPIKGAQHVKLIKPIIIQ